MEASTETDAPGHQLAGGTCPDRPGSGKMKSEFVFGLESATWPAIVVNDSGMVVRANGAASAAFAGVAEAGGSSLSAIWAQENESTAEVFLVRLERSPASSVAIKLRGKDGATAVFQAFISPFTKDGQRLLLLQLHRASEPGPPLPQAPALATQTPPRTPRLEPHQSGSSGLESGQGQRQKLDCALQLARTVALDFNNALTSILGHTSFILNKMEHDHPWRASLVEVEKSAEKAAEVASDLAAFSRQEKEAMPLVAGNLNDLVRRTLELFQGPGGPPIVWSLRLEPKLYTATFDEAKMQQAFIKILDNAIQAIGGKGGQLTISTRNQDVSDPIQDGSLHLAPGQYVCLEFEDNGCGIPPNVLPRIFEPFFTTKQSSTHRGLGLAWVYGIVTNHGGSVAVTSEAERGTSVHVYLPAQRKIVRDLAIQPDDLAGNQTVLMVDDEELLLTMGVMVLSSFGYRVLTANSGQKALDIFSKNRDQIDLIITDLVMPRMSGRELMERLRRLAPEIRILCTSGYVRTSSGEAEELYLQKPFTTLDLLRKVKQALTDSDGS